MILDHPSSPSQLQLCASIFILLLVRFLRHAILLDLIKFSHPLRCTLTLLSMTVDHPSWPSRLQLCASIFIFSLIQLLEHTIFSYLNLIFSSSPNRFSLEIFFQSSNLVTSRSLFSNLSTTL